MSDQPIIVDHRPSVEEVDGNLDRVDNNELSSDDVESNKVGVFEKTISITEPAGKGLTRKTAYHTLIAIVAE